MSAACALGGGGRRVLCIELRAELFVEGQVTFSLKVFDNKGGCHVVPGGGNVSMTRTFAKPEKEKGGNASTSGNKLLHGKPEFLLR